MRMPKLNKKKEAVLLMRITKAGTTQTEPIPKSRAANIRLP